MKIKTRIFGEVDIDDGRLIQFPNGIVGFPDLKDFALIHDADHPAMHKRFEACYKDNIHSIWANQELYRPGNSIEEFENILEKNMRPVYDSARRQGYELWKIS